MVFLSFLILNFVEIYIVHFLRQKLSCYTCYEESLNGSKKYTPECCILHLEVKFAKDISLLQYRTSKLAKPVSLVNMVLLPLLYGFPR